jgi:hypothetical protein
MTATTLSLEPEFDAILSRAVARTPISARAEFADAVMRRVCNLDRLLTPDRLHSIIGGVWHGLSIRPLY